MRERPAPAIFGVRQVDEIGHDEIRAGPEREPRLRLPRLSSLSLEQRFAVVTVGGLAVVAAMVAATAASHHRPAPPAAAAAPSTAPAPSLGPHGAAVVGCTEATWWNLGSSWRADSVRAGPLWLLGARETGYARLAAGPGRDATTTASAPAPASTVTAVAGVATPGASATRAATVVGRPAGSQTWLMVVHVSPGATVLLRAAAGSVSYFQLIDGEPVGPYRSADGYQALEFLPCRQAGTSHGSWVALYNLGFGIKRGRSASVEVLTSGSAKPTWLTFRAPG